jgi:transposase-like protein
MSRSCPHCSSRSTTELEQKTILGYCCFRCTSCERHLNERTGSPFNFLGFPTDVVLLVVRWRLRYQLSLRDLAEMFLERGFEFTHEAARAWEERFAPMIGDALRPEDTARDHRLQLVRGRDLREGRRPVVLPVPSQGL